MLVITRKSNEAFMIGDDVEITVLEIGKDKIKIGINAPKEVKISRKEIYFTENENKQAANIPSVEVIKRLLENKGKGR